MSQAGLVSDQTSPASDVETLTGNSGGAVGPDGAFNINVIGAEGIIVTGSPGTNTLTIDMTNGAANTVGAVTADILTIPLGATPGTYTFDIRVSMFEPATNLGGGYGIIGAVRTTGAAATVIGTPDFVVAEDAALAACDIDLIANLNTAVVRSTGIAAKTLHWKASAIWTFVS